MENYANLRVQQDDKYPSSWRVWLNDEEITHQCRSVDVSFAEGRLTSATIELVVGQVNARSNTANP